MLYDLYNVDYLLGSQVQVIKAVDNLGLHQSLDEGTFHVSETFWNWNFLKTRGN